MKSITKSLFFIIAFFGYCACNISAQDNIPVIRFGLIADIQYCNCDAAGQRFYRNSLPKLEKCVTDLNNQQVEFTVNLGDFVDKTPDDLDSVLIRLKRLDKKTYNMTGNHDYNGITDNKALYKKLNMPATYYTFKKKNWRFIVLNTNEVASYSNIKNTKLDAELTQMLKKGKADGRKNTATWNGGISNEQMQWLDKTLAKSQKKGEMVIICSHHPLYPEMGFTALNDREILQTIEKYSCVKALLAGHHHTGAFAYYKGIPSITAEGMVETKNENAYGIVEIYPDKILLKGEGRMTSREIEYQ